MGIAPASGDEFFPVLVHHLARALDVSCALVGEFPTAYDGNITSLTVNLHGKLAGNFEYLLHGSPFEQIGDGNPLSYPRGLRERFPADQLLREMKFESCTATPLQDSEGHIVGLLAVMDEHSQKDPDLVSEVLRFLAPRVGAEFERKQHEEAFQFTQFSIDRSGDAAFWMGSDGRFTYVNDAACRSLGYTREELLAMRVPDIDAIHDAEKWPDTWNHGDWAYVDVDGHWFLRGRADDTIKIAGRRTGPAEIEAALIEHESVIEAAAIGVPHDVKGSELVCFVVLKDDVGARHAVPIQEELKQIVIKPMGKAHTPKAVHIVSALPKTRSAKIVRGVIQKKYLGKPLGDTASVENPAAIEAIPTANR